MNRKLTDETDPATLAHVKSVLQVVLHVERDVEKLVQGQAEIRADLHRVQARLDDMDARFEQIDVRFEQIDVRFDEIVELIKATAGPTAPPG